MSTFMSWDFHYNNTCHTAMNNFHIDAAAVQIRIQLHDTRVEMTMNFSALAVCMHTPDVE